ncbi:MAG TPA: hypothetical protein VKI99_05485 [Candidatus Dormibacteraeota bacterium]|nr:hypothetical protein [Candidatus Dormibacteraeota bacterium]
MTTVTAIASVATSSDRLAGVVFAVAAGILLVSAGLMLLQASLDRDPLRGSLVIVLAGLVAALGYESYALWTGAVTISKIAAQQFQDHPGPWLAILLVVMLVLGGVVVDFVYRSKRAWLVLAGGAAASVGGGLIAHFTGWVP